MGLFDNILNKIAPPEENDFAEDTPEQPMSFPRDPRYSANEPVAPVSPIPTQPKPLSNGTNVIGSAIEMKVVKPDRFELVGDIADLLLKGNTVLLNLEDTNKETTRRIIDFMTGVAYAIGGDLRRIANNTYVITPDNVRVSDTEEPEAGENAN